MPHDWMVLLFGGAFLFAIVAMMMGVRNFWRDVNKAGPTKTDLPSLWQAMRDASSLRYLDGGGVGCFNEDEEPTDRRRVFHHLTFYGFLLCFASTSVASLYHMAGHEAPYPWYALPVLLGTAGGIGLVIGPIGLMAARYRRRNELKEESHAGMENAFTLMLLLTAVTGLALLFLRATPAMGILLALHLGVVFALFITMPYGRFVHGLYRFAALVRYAREMGVAA
jgi:citrate/tricarballylate utilization protein